MGYPVYKLLRAVNRQYPNNGFINNVDVTESIYDSSDVKENKIIPEDLRDLINETIQEIYKDVAVDEVFTFPTVPGQNQYVLPVDCDLRDIQEVTRTFQGFRGPLPTPPGPAPLPDTVAATFDANGGEGVMPPIEVEFGTTIELPECSFVPPDGLGFLEWKDDEGNGFQPGDSVTLYQNETFSAVWHNKDPEPVWEYTVTFLIPLLAGEFDGGTITIIGGVQYSTVVVWVESGEAIGGVPTFTLESGYTFEGWTRSDYWDPTYKWTTPQIEALIVTEDLTITAECTNGSDVDPEPDWEDPDNPGGGDNNGGGGSDDWNDDFNTGGDNGDDNNDPGTVWE